MLMAADSDSPGVLAVPDKASRFAATAAVPATKKKLGTKRCPTPVRSNRGSRVRAHQMPPATTIATIRSAIGT